MNQNLYTIMAHCDDHSTITLQVSAPAVESAIAEWAKRYSASNKAVGVEYIGSDVRDLPVPRHDVLVVTPMEGLRNVWTFYGALKNDMISGEIVLTA